MAPGKRNASEDCDSLKRKDDEPEPDVQNVKRLKLDTPSSSSSPDESEISKLLCLSDDVLLPIFSYLSPADLRRLSRVCERLAGVTQDYSLWTNADFRSERMVFCALWDYLEFLQPSTTRIAIKGFADEKLVARKLCCVVDELMQKICERCPDLETFIMEEFTFSENELPFSSFPKTVKHFEMSSCHICMKTINMNYFRGIDSSMPQLQVLVLEKCFWLTTYAFMPISKCPNLRVLRVRGCIHLGNCVAYTSVSCRFGFKRLEELDVRETLISNAEISCFNQIGTLTHLWVERLKSDEEISAVNDEHRVIPETVFCYTEKYGKIKESEGSTFNSSHECPPMCSGLLGFEAAHEGSALITDEGILALGPRNVVVKANMITVRMVDVESIYNSKLQSLVVRDYVNVTDFSLEHLARLPRLQFLDMTGTSITREGVVQFKNIRPEVKIVSGFRDLEE